MQPTQTLATASELRRAPDVSANMSPIQQQRSVDGTEQGIKRSFDVMDSQPLQGNDIESGLQQPPHDYAPTGSPAQRRRLDHSVSPSPLGSEPIGSSSTRTSHFMASSPPAPDAVHPRSTQNPFLQAATHAAIRGRLPDGWEMIPEGPANPGGVGMHVHILYQCGLFQSGNERDKAVDALDVAWHCYRTPAAIADIARSCAAWDIVNLTANYRSECVRHGDPLSVPSLCAADLILRIASGMPTPSSIQHSPEPSSSCFTSAAGTSQAQSPFGLEGSRPRDQVA